jgi:hypothetical protein
MKYEFKIPVLDIELLKNTSLPPYEVKNYLLVQTSGPNHVEAQIVFGSTKLPVSGISATCCFTGYRDFLNKIKTTAQDAGVPIYMTTQAIEALGLTKVPEDGAVIGVLRTG